MAVLCVIGDEDTIISKLFDKVVEAVKKGKSVIWIEDRGTIPFGQLPARLQNKEQLDSVQYIRVFSLEGCIEVLETLQEGNYVLMFSSFGSMLEDRNDEIESNYLNEKLMRMMRRLSMVGVDSFVGGGMNYFVDGQC